MQELTFNIDDRREIKPPTSVENFHLTFGNQPGADLPGDNWVQGRQNADSLRQVFVNIRQGSNDMPYNVTGFILQFAGRTAVHSDGKSYRIIDNSSVVVDGANGRMRFTFPAAAFAVAGTYKQAYFRLIREADYKCVATLEFDLSVVQDFVFNDIMPSDWVDPFNDVRKQLQASFSDFQAQSQSDLADTKKQLQAMFDQASQRVSDTVEQMTSLGATVKEGLQTAQTALEALQLKIQQNGLFTQDEAKKLNDTVSKNLHSLKENVQEMVDFDVDFFDPIPSPYNDAAKYFVTNIKNDLPSMLLVQDLHYDHAIYPEEYGKAVELGIKQLSHLRELDGKINAVILNGDITHGRSSKANVLTAMREVKSNLDCYYPQTDKIYTMGNHDANTVYSPTDTSQHLTEDELKNIWGVNQLYAVKDIGEKLRLIVLNAYEISNLPKYPNAITSLFKADQLRFLASNLETNRDVLVFMHCPPQGYFGNQPYPVTYQGNETTININHDVLLGIMQAFAHKESTTITGTNNDYPVSIDVDFSGYNGHLAGIITGHEHLDRNPDERNGVIVTTRINNLAYSTQAGQRNWGTVNADAFDVVQVDVDNRTVFFKRFGYGNDLSYRY